MGRFVPIYEGMGGTRAARHPAADLDRAAAFDGQIPDRLPVSVLGKNQLAGPRHRTARNSFPHGEQALEKLCNFRTPAQVRLIFEEFFNVGAGLALKRRKAKAAQKGSSFKAASARAGHSQYSALPPHRRAEAGAEGDC